MQPLVSFLFMICHPSSFHKNDISTCQTHFTVYESGCQYVMELNVSYMLPPLLLMLQRVYIINPQCACAARVVVLVLCVCVCVCPLPLICRPTVQGSQRAIPTASVLRCRHCFKKGVFLKLLCYKEEMCHFCASAYNYTRAYTFYVQSLYVSTFTHNGARTVPCFFHMHRALRGQHLHFR